MKEKPFRHAIWLLFARTYRTSGLADETGTSSCAGHAITPAISVLSAVEALGIATPALNRFILPLTVVVLL